MGIGDNSNHNQFGPYSDLSRDYSGLLEKICLEVARYDFCSITRTLCSNIETASSSLHDTQFSLSQLRTFYVVLRSSLDEFFTHNTCASLERGVSSNLFKFSFLFLIPISNLTDAEERRDDSNQMGPFEATGLGFAMVMANLYDLQYVPGSNGGKRSVSPYSKYKKCDERGVWILPKLLREACKDLNFRNLSHSGWAQFYLYQILYCCDVEKPRSEEQIKRVSC